MCRDAIEKFDNRDRRRAGDMGHSGFGLRAESDKRILAINVAFGSNASSNHDRESTSHGGYIVMAGSGPAMTRNVECPTLIHRAWGLTRPSFPGRCCEKAVNSVRMRRVGGQQKVSNAGDHDTTLLRSRFAIRR